jgi:tetratricopeptide (TPR) repeat protein
MPILAPFEAFAHDAAALNVDEDDSRLPVKWLAAAQVAARLADSRPQERKSLLRIWVRQQVEDGADGVWSALAVPGIPVRDLASASAALCSIAADMERGGALNLAYSTVTHMRLAMLERGPAGARAIATLQQARVLRQMGLLEEASDTYEEAREDAVRAGDTELEARAFIGEAAVHGHRGNYPAVFEAGRRALELLPPTSEYVALAHNDLMIAAMATRDFPTAFEHGWKGYDAANDVERRASMIGNLSSLALRRGRFAAARRGFVATLGLSKLDRMQLPVLGGLALVSAATGDISELHRVAVTLEQIAAKSPLAYEVARARFELAQAWHESGNFEKASQCLAGASDLAIRHGFHEVTLRSEVLAEALEAIATAGSAGNRDVRVEKAIARFDELHVDERVLEMA